jgi:hypothetical protein
VHPPAVALLGLIGSLDGEIPCCLEPNGTAVVYPTVASRAMIPLVSLHPSASGLAAPTGLCYNPRPEAGWIGSTDPTQYKSHKPDSYMSPNPPAAKVTTPLPDFGTDRMGDFERVGTANLWKSGPLFSTGAYNSEPGFSGLRLKQCSPARNSGTASQAGEQEEMGGDFEPRLSTAFAEAGGHLPPTHWGSGHES